MKKGAHLIEREFQVQKALHLKQFPVPKPIIYCNDSSVIGSEFYLMEHVAGRIFRDPKLPELNRFERNEIYMNTIKVLSNLHSLNIKDLGLENFGNVEKSYFERQIKTWSRNYNDSKTEDINSMEMLTSWLPDNIPKGPVKLMKKNI